jgi:hypothetical protein
MDQTLFSSGSLPVLEGRNENEEHKYVLLRCMNPFRPAPSAINWRHATPECVLGNCTCRLGVYAQIGVAEVSLPVVGSCRLFQEAVGEMGGTGRLRHLRALSR